MKKVMMERENCDELSSGDKIRESPDDKIEFQEKGFDYLSEKSSDLIKIIGGFDEKSSKRPGLGSSQELTLSYLCDNNNNNNNDNNNSKLGFPDKEFSGQNLLNTMDRLGGRYKGKEVLVSEDVNEENGNNSNLWVERDFLRMNENRGVSSKRDFEKVENEGENREKKAKVESLNLSLALPDVSLSLSGSNRVQNVDLPSRVGPQSLGPSYNNNTQTTTFSNDFTTGSFSSYSHAFSHNPSCSLTQNSTENYEYSMGGSNRRDYDQIWNGGEGTNGSVHSRFRPIGDGTVGLVHHGGLSSRSGFNKDSCNNSVFGNGTASSDNHSFLPSELPARPRLDAARSEDSRRRNSDNLRGGSENLDVVRSRKLSRPERILREIVSESITVMSQIIQEISDETIESTKEYLKNVISTPERKDELTGLQNRLERRSDLTNEALLKSQRSQLEILVAIKMGQGSFLNSKTRLPSAELVEIFLLERCRNVNCKRLLPVEDCECKICSTKKGFCSECMCPVCLNFDCAANTCSWVGCDVCSHWCHADCGIQRNLIKPGPTLKGTSEMHFHCLGCGHASEMFGFVKDVFVSCAKDWDLGTLIKELDCVRKIFGGSEDRKGKELCVKADEMRAKLQNKMINTSDACNFIFQFFNSTNGFMDVGSSSMPSKELSFGKEASLALSNSLTPKPPSSFYNTTNSSSGTPFDFHHNEAKFPTMSENVIEDEWSVKKPSRKDGFESLESLVRIKDAEARMFQSRADEARREIEGYRRMIRMKTEELDEEYGEKIGKLCLQETEERRRKKMEELKMLENSHCDYYKMKIRMQSEISGLLKRMEATKQQLV